MTANEYNILFVIPGRYRLCFESCRKSAYLCHEYVRVFDFMIKESPEVIQWGLN